MKEEYRTIEEFPNYEVSNLGNVRNKRTNKILKGNDNGKGYPKVSLYNNGLMKSYKIQRLVANSFIPNPLNLSDIRHLDGDKTNNNVDNLKWSNHLDAVFFSRDYKQILQFDLKGNFIKEWDNVREIQNNTKFKINYIYKCCRKEIHSINNYIWRYKNEYI